jgi:hypothetical protein
MKTAISIFSVTCFLTASITFGADQFTPATSAGQAVNAANNVFLNLQNQAVADSVGQQAGTLDYVLVSPGGCVDVALISIGQQRVVAVPWQLMTVQSSTASTTANAQGVLTPTGRTAATPFQLQVDAARLRQAPSFAVNQLNALNQQGTLQQVYQYFGVQPQNATASGQQNTTNAISTPAPPTDLQNQANTNLPPGLQRRETLPPGLDQRETLPPGIQRSTGSAPTRPVIPPAPGQQVPHTPKR